MAVLAPQLVVKAEYFAQGVLGYASRAACPHCGSGESELVTRKYLVIRIARCRRCGLVFSRPIYRSRLSANFYDRLYAAEGSTTSIPDDATLARLASTHFRGTDKDATANLAAIRRAAGPGARTLLELGSSWGYFLDQARAEGFEVAGVEIGTTRREFGRARLGLEIVPGFEALAPGRRFDVIYTAHVLEHFTDVSSVFKELALRLADGGRVFIEVPNIDPEAAGDGVLSMVGAVHPLGFHARWFRENLPRHGLEVVSVHERWEELPSREVERSSRGVVIVQAKRA